LNGQKTIARYCPFKAKPQVHTALEKENSKKASCDEGHVFETNLAKRFEVRSSNVMSVGTDK
jgi:hypothetical protein